MEKEILANANLEVVDKMTKFVQEHEELREFKKNSFRIFRNVDDGVKDNLYQNFTDSVIKESNIRPSKKEREAFVWTLRNEHTEWLQEFQNDSLGIIKELLDSGYRNISNNVLLYKFTQRVDALEAQKKTNDIIESHGLPLKASVTDDYELIIRYV